MRRQHLPLLYCPKRSNNVQIVIFICLWAGTRGLSFTGLEGGREDKFPATYNKTLKAVMSFDILHLQVLSLSASSLLRQNISNIVPNLTNKSQTHPAAAMNNKNTLAKCGFSILLTRTSWVPELLMKQEQCPVSSNFPCSSLRRMQCF